MTSGSSGLRPARPAVPWQIYFDGAADAPAEEADGRVLAKLVILV